MRAATRGTLWAAALLVTLTIVLTGVAIGQSPIVWRWEETGPLPQSYINHTATLLADGRVLVVGGEGAAGTTAALFDPASETWSETGPLVASRVGHTATLLADGRVLVAGGLTDETLPIRAVELFDPATGVWTAAADMAVARAYHAAALLPDGDVLVTGGLVGANGTAAVERYDPTTDTWTFAAEMKKARIQHTATVLADGRVLVAGGYLPGNVAELYDPATDRWRYTGGRAVAFPERHVAVRLDDGRVYAVGSDEAAVYDPAAEAWTPLSSPALGDLFAATLLGDGRVIVTGGYEYLVYPPVTIFHDATVLVDPATWEWEWAAYMHWGRAGHTLTRLADGSVLAAGGDYDGTAEVLRSVPLTVQVLVPVILRGEE